MTCNGCVKHVTEALRGVPGVAGVKVSLPDRAEVDGTAPVDQLSAAVESAGYGVTPEPARA